MGYTDEDLKILNDLSIVCLYYKGDDMHVDSITINELNGNSREIFKAIEAVPHEDWPLKYIEK